MKIDRPVFFIGMGRSGTSVLFEIFAAHEQLGWISNYSARFPHWPIANLMLRFTDTSQWYLRGKKQQYGKNTWRNRFLPKPQEGYPFWESYCGEKFLWEFHLKPETDPDVKSRLHEAVINTLLYQGKKRFATKLTGPARILYLRSIFPDAIFVHVIRDGRAVVDSLLRVDFWREKGGHERPFWKNALGKDDFIELDTYGAGPVALAAIEWRNVIESIRGEAEDLGGKEYIEVKYEDFVKSPTKTVGMIYEFCSLPQSNRATRQLSMYREFRNMNEKYRSRSKEDIAIMNGIMGVLLAKLGYSNPA